jgi:hypothetical protein
MTVNGVERLEHFAIMSGLAPQSVGTIRPDFPRWVRCMENGVTEIPDSPLASHSHAVNMASLLIWKRAWLKGDSITHELGNLTGVRSGSYGCARPVWVRSQALTMTSFGSLSCFWLRSG